jgi:hypothetical protein
MVHQMIENDQFIRMHPFTPFGHLFFLAKNAVDSQDKCACAPSVASSRLRSRVA